MPIKSLYFNTHFKTNDNVIKLNNVKGNEEKAFTE